MPFFTFRKGPLLLLLLHPLLLSPLLLLLLLLLLPLLLLLLIMNPTTRLIKFRENLSPLVLQHYTHDAPDIAGDADDCLAAPPAPAPHRRSAGPMAPWASGTSGETSGASGETSGASGRTSGASGSTSGAASSTSKDTTTEPLSPLTEPLRLLEGHRLAMTLPISTGASSSASSSPQTPAYGPHQQLLSRWTAPNGSELEVYGLGFVSSPLMPGNRDTL